MLSYLSSYVWSPNQIPKYCYGYKKDTITTESILKQPELAKYKTFKFHPYLSHISKMDLRDNFPPVFDQGRLGSCVFNAIDGAYGFEMLKQAEPFLSMSRLFMYYNVRKNMGTINEDSGAEIKDAVYNISSNYDSVGTCEESMWPYDISKFAEEPPIICYSDAKNHHIVAAERIEQDLNHIKQSIVDGYPIVFGFVVYESFESNEVATTGKMPMPSSNEKQLGGHAIVAVGFDDVNKVIICRNSWGIEWGDKGYFTMPYEFIVRSDYASDFWSIRFVKDDKIKCHIDTPCLTENINDADDALSVVEPTKLLRLPVFEKLNIYLKEENIRSIDNNDCQNAIIKSDILNKIDYLNKDNIKLICDYNNEQIYNNISHAFMKFDYDIHNVLSNKFDTSFEMCSEAPSNKLFETSPRGATRKEVLSNKFDTSLLKEQHMQKIKNMMKHLNIDQLYDLRLLMDNVIEESQLPAVEWINAMFPPIHQDNYYGCLNPIPLTTFLEDESSEQSQKKMSRRKKRRYRAMQKKQYSNDNFNSNNF